MKELSTPYLGNASAVGKIVNSLPEIEPFLKYRNMELKTTEEPYRLVLNFDEIVLPDQPENPLYSSPYFHTRKFNNALLLMMMIDNLSYVDFEISIPKEYRYEDEPEVQVYSISRDDMEKARNLIAELKIDPSLYYTTLDYNNAVDSYRIRYERMQLGRPEELLLLRWGEPLEKKVVLGEEEPSEYLYQGNSGQSVSVRVAHGTSTVDRQIVEISFDSEGKGITGGEILETLLLNPKEGEILRRNSVTERLGSPRMHFESTDFYRLNSGLSDYLYFEYNESNEVAKYGVIRKNLRSAP